MKNSQNSTKPGMPSSWALSTLGEFVAKRSKGIVPKKTPGRTFELYSVPSFESDRPEVVSGGNIGSNKQIVEEGTVLLCKINPRINRSWVVSSHSAHQKIASTEWITFPRRNTFEPKYLAYYLNQDVVRDFLASNASGVGGSLMRVKPATIKDYPFPIAPPDQQIRIVAEIEKQFSRLDEAVANLKRVKANLKRYKAAVLKAAVEGKLTEEWRWSERKRAQAKELEEIPRASKGKLFVYVIECDNGNYFVGQTSDLRGRWREHCKSEGAEWTSPYPPKYLVHFEEFSSQGEAIDRENELNTPSGHKWIEHEVAAGRLKPLVHNPDNENCLPVQGGETSQELLERILAERRAKWEEAELAKMKAKGKVPKDDGWKRKYKAPIQPGPNNYSILPVGWAWACADQLTTTITDGEHITPERSEAGVPLLSARNIQDGTLSFDKVDYVPQHVHDKLKQRLTVREGDVLLSCSGTVGRSCVAPHNSNFSLVRSVAVLKPLSNMGKFISYSIRSPLLQRQINEKKTQTAQANIFQGRIRTLMFALPPLSEQAEIIMVIEERFSIAEEIEVAIATNLKRAERLRQSIFQKAFSGQLIGHDPDDERARLECNHERRILVGLRGGVRAAAGGVQRAPAQTSARREGHDE